LSFSKNGLHHLIPYGIACCLLASYLRIFIKDYDTFRINIKFFTSSKFFTLILVGIGVSFTHYTVGLLTIWLTSLALLFHPHIPKLVSLPLVTFVSISYLFFGSLLIAADPRPPGIPFDNPITALNSLINNSFGNQLATPIPVIALTLLGLFVAFANKKTALICFFLPVLILLIVVVGTPSTSPSALQSFARALGAPFFSNNGRILLCLTVLSLPLLFYALSSFSTLLTKIPYKVPKQIIATFLVTGIVISDLNVYSTHLFGNPYWLNFSVINNSQAQMLGKTEKMVEPDSFVFTDNLYISHTIYDLTGLAVTEIHPELTPFEWNLSHAAITNMCEISNQNPAKPVYFFETNRSYWNPPKVPLTRELTDPNILLSDGTNRLFALNCADSE
jgi:hypothetical protein